MTSTGTPPKATHAFPRVKTWIRSIVVWLLIIIAESIHGTLRQLYLAPLIGDFRARRISVFTGIALIFVMAFLTIRWLRAHDTGTLVRIGALWATLTMLFEASLGRALAVCRTGVLVELENG